MTQASSAELQRRLASEFDRLGWEYDIGLGGVLMQEVDRAGKVHAGDLADSVPAVFLHKNNLSRADLKEAIERAWVGVTSIRRETQTTLVINDNRYQVNIQAGGAVIDSNINIGAGTQINLDGNATKADILRAVEVLLHAGLEGHWNADAARDLSSLVERRDDLDVEDVHRTTAQAVEAVKPKRARLKELLRDIAVSGIGGAFGTGISSGVGEAISRLPL